MDDLVARTIRNIQSIADLAQFERNAARHQALDEDIRRAIRARSIELGRVLVAERAGLDLSDLSPAEEKIVLAASEYAGVKKRTGSDAGRTFMQLRNRGLIGAAEVSVIRSKPTQGFQGLADADLADLSYEQIIVDHPEEFSARALWYAKRTLGLPNDSDKPPAKGASITQERTESLLRWYAARSAVNGGYLNAFTNVDAAAAIGITDLQRSGRVFGNIQSRIDYGCYALGLPPLGLAADMPFDIAWQNRDRDWAYPIADMQTAARTRHWSSKDFELILDETQLLPGQAHVTWRKEDRVNEAGIRRWAFGLKDLDPTAPPASAGRSAPPRRNPPWSRDELILALDLYLRFRDALPSKDSAQVIELSRFLSRNHTQDAADATYRNPNGVYMKMNNFRRFDPGYTADGKVGLERGNKLEEEVWDEFVDDREALAATVSAIRSGATIPESPTPYWAFVCNPKKWAIDRFFDRNIVQDSWGVRRSDRHKFAPGQLGIVRVGVDRRTKEERNGVEPLEAGIYALCEVESEAYPGTGANDGHWAEGEGRAPGWPTVKIRYLRIYRDRPLTIETLAAQRPDVSKLLLNGFQASSFPISADDFHAVLDLLGENLDDLPAEPEAGQSPEALSELQKKYQNASPEVKERVSRYIERGSVGAQVKRELGFKCQVCAALGRDSISFIKKNGELYAEAHHVTPVSALQAGCLAASNVMVLCANHHRQMHYGGVDVVITTKTFEFTIDGQAIVLPRLMTESPADAAAEALTLLELAANE